MVLRRKRTMRYRRPPVAIEHTAFHAYLVAYNDAMAVRGYSPRTAIVARAISGASPAGVMNVASHVRRT